MHQNIFWQVFLIVICFIVLSFTIYAVYKVCRYYSLNQMTKTDFIQWEVEEKSNEEFIIRGNYLFQVEGKEYEGSTLFKDRMFRNLWAAEKALLSQPQRSLPVWYSQSNPKYSSLQKTFPLKECLSAVLLACILIYFVGIGYYHAAQTVKQEQRKAP